MVVDRLSCRSSAALGVWGHDVVDTFVDAGGRWLICTGGMRPMTVVVMAPHLYCLPVILLGLMDAGKEAFLGKQSLVSLDNLVPFSGTTRMRRVMPVRRPRWWPNCVSSRWMRRADRLCSGRSRLSSRTRVTKLCLLSGASGVIAWVIGTGLVLLDGCSDTTHRAVRVPVPSSRLATAASCPQHLGSFCRVADHTAEGESRIARKYTRLVAGARGMRKRLCTQPDWDFVHRELAGVGAALKLLHGEHRDACTAMGAPSMGCNRFCKTCQQHGLVTGLSTRVRRKAGQSVEVDWSGKTMRLSDPVGGRSQRVHAFVGCLPFSRYAFVWPTLDMKQGALPSSGFHRCSASWSSAQSPPHR